MARVPFAYRNAYKNPLKAKFGEAFFTQLPKVPAVYFFLDANGDPLYIGKADNLKRRLMSYQAAKPGQAPEHILEMIESAERIRWEEHDSGEEALRRETDLIHAIRPPYNIAGSWEIDYLYLGLRAEHTPRKKSGLTKVEFRLSRVEIDEGFEMYGCFRHRGKTKAGYTALLRLFFAALCSRERFSLPAKICRSSPPYIYDTELPLEWIEALKRFLRGDDHDLLHLIMDRLLQKTELPKQLYIPLQRDFVTAREFFELGPKDTKALAKKAGIKQGRLSKARMDQIIARELSRQLLDQ